MANLEHHPRRKRNRNNQENLLKKLESSAEKKNKAEQEIKRILDQLSEYETTYLGKNKSNLKIFFEELIETIISELEYRKAHRRERTIKLNFALIIDGLPGVGKTFLYYELIEKLVKLLEIKIRYKFNSVFNFQYEYLHWDKLEDILKEAIKQLSPLLNDQKIDAKWLGLARVLLTAPTFQKLNLQTEKQVAEELLKLYPQSDEPYPIGFLEITRMIERYLFRGALSSDHTGAHIVILDKPGGSQYEEEGREYDTYFVLDMISGKDEFNKLLVPNTYYISMSPGAKTMLLALQRDLQSERKAKNLSNANKVARIFGGNEFKSEEDWKSASGGSFKQVLESRKSTNEIIRKLIEKNKLNLSDTSIIPFLQLSDDPDFMRTVLLNLKTLSLESKTETLLLIPYNLTPSQGLTNTLKETLKASRIIQTVYPIAIEDLFRQAVYDLAGTGMQLQLQDKIDEFATKRGVSVKQITVVNSPANIDADKINTFELNQYLRGQSGQRQNN